MGCQMAQGVVGATDPQGPAGEYGTINYTSEATTVYLR
jgi:hypothetical protein